MTKDLNKDVVTMSWNSLNLPDTIQLKGGHMESFIYDATGQKEQVTRVTVTTSNVTIPIGRTLNNAGISVTKTSAIKRYASNVVYSDNRISEILLPDGILKRTNAITSNPPVFSYNYYIKDHLGNVRTVIDGSGVIKQVNNYYPFGMEYGESAENQTMMTYQDYQYGGKEFDRKFEINLYDFHARPYDATRAQWTSPDPLAEKYYSISPYAYCANNPLKFVDPDGKEIIILSEIIDGRKKLSIDVSGKVKNSTSTDYSHEQLQEYANRLMSSISEKYSGSGENIDYSCNVNLTVASSDNPVTSSDHVFNIVEQGSVQGYEGNLNAAGSTRIGSMTVDLSQNIVDVFPAQYGEYSGTGKSLAGNATLERTGSHEFGHTAGLKHSTDSNNLMKQTRDPNAGMKITEDQILKIVNDYNNDKLNK